MGARFCRSVDTYGAAPEDCVGSSEGGNDSSRLLQPTPLHRGSVLGITSARVAIGRRAIFTCSDDKRIAVIDESYEPGRECDPPISWEPANALGSAHSDHDRHDKAINRLAAGSLSLFSCSRDLAVKQWRISSREGGLGTTLSLVRSFDRAHELTIADITTSADGTVLCSGSRDYSVKVWDVASGKCTQEFRAPRNVVTSLLLAPESPMLFQGSEDLCVRVWDSRAPARQPAVHITGYVYFPLSLALHPEQTVLATGSCLRPHGLVSPNPNLNPPKTHFSLLPACLPACAPSLPGCKGFDSNGCEVKLWDLRSPGRPLADLKGHSMDVTAVGYCAAGRLYSASKDGSLAAWGDAGLGSPAAACRSTGKHFTSLVVHGSASGAALLAGAFDGSVSRYRFSGDTESLQLQAATPPFFASADD